ncbi:CysB family HTH-type transcriptional regulator [Thiofilum flexile]|uniref:CysB family HTH-type transcriptional regulator n=1 Tax=Thiofilum flexile TaxID=125627 RepID=UPI00036C2DEA|nr:CysB family HTH-type transcriptional regulator [Thiofilum flexile]
MNFQQLRIVRETVRCNFNLTEVAQVLFTSQSGVSKHLKDLEDELGVTLFVRRGKRLLGLTDPGRELLGIVKRVLLDAHNIKQLAEQFSNSEEGSLTIATTHTQARYILPPIVSEFKKHFPKVNLVLHQCHPSEIVQRLQSGKADIGIATEALQDASTITTFPFYTWHHAVVVPHGHELTQVPNLSLEHLAAYPLLTYYDGITGRANIDQAFAELGLKPNIVIAALDSDVIKTYIELGLGVGILAAMSFNPQRDLGLTLLEVPQLFKSNTTQIGVRQGHYLRAYAYRFIESCSARLTEPLVRELLATTKN